MVKFLKWLKPAVEKGGQTEITIDEKLTSLRAEQDKYVNCLLIRSLHTKNMGQSFITRPNRIQMSLLKRRECYFWIQAQYLDRTTDITRTISLGKTTDKEKACLYISVERTYTGRTVQIPVGVSGTQLDVLAKKDMWQEGLSLFAWHRSWGGSFLNVHEGPHQIRMEWKPAPLVKGMTVTDEPGI